MKLLDRVRANRTAILNVAERHGASNVRIFGSAARGEAGPSSDLDVLVNLAPDRSLLDHVGLQQDLEELLGCPVDVVVEGGLNPHLLEDRILKEAVPL